MKCWFNCVTFAFDIESELTARVEKLDHCLGPIDAVKAFAKAHNRKARVLKNQEDKLYDGEWMIVFFGFISGGFDNEDEGSPRWYNYHLVRQMKNGVWKHRGTFGGAIKIADMNYLVPEYGKYGYEPFYFAISKEIEEGSSLPFSLRVN